MDDYISYLNEVIPDKDCLKIVKSEAEKVPEFTFFQRMSYNRDDSISIR